MSDQPSLIGRRTTVACLVAAPVCEVAEALLSPLSGTSTAADLRGVAAHPGLFVASVLVGIVATVLYVPAFLGLATRCLVAAPVAARLGAAFATASMLGFMGIRMAQGVELQGVRDGLDRGDLAALTDHVAANPVGVAMLVLLLAGSAVGLVALGVAGWRAGLPRPALVLMAGFPFFDLALPSQSGTVASHVLLLAGLASLATAVARGTDRGSASVGQEAPVVA